MYVNLYSSLEAAKDLVLYLPALWKKTILTKPLGKLRQAKSLRHTGVHLHNALQVKESAQRNVKWLCEKMNLQYSRNTKMEQSHARNWRGSVPKVSHWGRPQSPWDLTDMNEECFHLAYSESECTCTYSMFPGREVLLEALTEEESWTKRNFLVATCGHKGLRAGSTRLTKK